MTSVIRVNELFVEKLLTRTKNMKQYCCPFFEFGVLFCHLYIHIACFLRYGEQSANHKRELEEKWKIEEVDFNAWGLSEDFFRAPTEFVKK